MPSERLEHERLNKKTALAVLSSDAISSVAYATDQILFVLGGAIGKLVNMFGGKGAREGVTSMVAVSAPPLAPVNGIRVIPRKSAAAQGKRAANLDTLVVRMAGDPEAPEPTLARIGVDV